MVQNVADRYDTEVLVVGAGPTGMVLASELTRHGVRCRIIDRLPHGSQESKALGVQARTLELFEKMGIAKAMLEYGVQIKGMSVYSHHQRIAHLDTRSIPSHYPFILSIPQWQTERILSDHLARQQVEIEHEVALVALRQDDSGVEALLEHADGQQERVRARWLAGCDGPHSTVRHLLKMGFEGRTFEQSFALADVFMDWYLPHQQAAFFLQEGDIVACFPLPDSLHRIIIAYKPRSAPEEDVTLEEVQQALEKCGLKDARVHDMSWSSRFHINQRKVQHYRQGAVFLAGDACHIHSPIGGQGMNTGIQDAFNLAWKLALVSKQQAHPALLDSYEEERERVGRQLLRVTDLVSRLALLRNSLPSRLRDGAAHLVTNSKQVRNLLATTISQLGVSYRRSPVICEHQPGRLYEALSEQRLLPGELHAGERALDVNVHLGITSMRLHTLCLGTRHVLFVFARRHDPERSMKLWEEIDGLVRREFSDLVDSYLVLPCSQEASESGRTRTIYDASEAMYTAYGIAEDGLVLVRPDGYIGFLCRPIELERLWSYLDRIFIVSEPRPVGVVRQSATREQ
ncbi:FAD-dependent monooxygenase [Ktedonobacter racemifer]|uniref:Monooxygenase FAD-binding n=1 Tax=Ktedonobacter racemifer DSM 44963 TaxID=485913 RepID=D6TV31_KTERA|nr:FAD-dependent monooxygenase [Ktedonobacter racemifer]EFH84131.1 monooxygenase FAD-binding [Ktedonobacter racemifer DSM 44963]